MEKGRRELLKKVPTRKLLAAIKKDIRQTLREAKMAGKPKKK
jgi:hypothetical protein